MVGSDQVLPLNKPNYTQFKLINYDIYNQSVSLSISGKLPLVGFSKRLVYSPLFHSVWPIRKAQTSE